MATMPVVGAVAPASTRPICIASWTRRRVVGDILHNFLRASYDFEWFMAVVGGSQDPGSPPELSRSRPPPTSSCGSSVNNAIVSPRLLASRATMPENSAMTMPSRAASPGSNRRFNLWQALKPSSSLMLITTFFDSLSVILRSSLQKLVCSSITWPYFVSRACLERSSMTFRLLVDLAGTFFIPGVIVFHVVGNFLLSAPPLVRLVCEVLWDQLFWGK